MVEATLRVRKRTLILGLHNQIVPVKNHTLQSVHLMAGMIIIAYTMPYGLIVNRMVSCKLERNYKHIGSVVSI